MKNLILSAVAIATLTTSLSAGALVPSGFTEVSYKYFVMSQGYSYVKSDYGRCVTSDSMGIGVYKLGVISNTLTVSEKSTRSGSVYFVTNGNGFESLYYPTESGCVSN
jgi:hypothetical protein